MSAETDMLNKRLIQLGEMMGDGLHHEPDGKWIAREYRSVCKRLGIIKPGKRDTSTINERMVDRVSDVPCLKCGGQLKQTRSGSMRAACVSCGSKFQLLKKARRTR